MTTIKRRYLTSYERIQMMRSSSFEKFDINRGKSTHTMKEEGSHQWSWPWEQQRLGPAESPAGLSPRSSSSLSSSSKGFCLWKMQHFLELLRLRNSLSTVPSFQETFFLGRLSRRTRVSGGCDRWEEVGAEEEEEGDSSSIVRVRVPVVDGAEVLAIARRLVSVRDYCSKPILILPNPFLFIIPLKSNKLIDNVFLLNFYY